jgi:hypothetical protein
VEWNEILIFIEKWWIEAVLAGVASAMGMMARHYYKLNKKAK